MGSSLKPGSSSSVTVGTEILAVIHKVGYRSSFSTQLAEFGKFGPRHPGDFSHYPWCELTGDPAAGMGPGQVVIAFEKESTMRPFRLDRRLAIAAVLAVLLPLGPVASAAAAPLRSDENSHGAWTFVGELWNVVRALWEREGARIDPNRLSTPSPRPTAPRALSAGAGGHIDPDGVATPPPAESGTEGESDAGSHIDPDG